MRKLTLGITFAVFCAGSVPYLAASPATDAFVANVRLGVTFLDQSSLLAADRTDNSDLGAFAGKEARDGAAVITALDRHTTLDVAQTIPLAVASNDVMTGRSVAIDRTPVETSFSAPVGLGALMPAATITLDRLASSKGQAFVTMFKATQVDVLRQLAALYDAYSATGDDAALKQLARNERAAANDRIAEIGRF